MPEGVWKAYIDFEIENAQNGPKPCDFSKVRGLYGRLLDITQHVKVWISYA
jgi:crooked neck